MARAGYLPKFLAKLSTKHHTPFWALLLPGMVCLGTALTGLTDVVIVVSVFGSVVMYIISLVSLFILRRKEPELKRPFKVFYPIIPSISFVLALFCLFCLLVTSGDIIPYVLLVYMVAVVYYFIWGNKNIRPFEEEFVVLDKSKQDE